MVDCVGYPYLVFSRQCQVFPYCTPTASVIAPFSTIVVLHNIARSQVRFPYFYTPIPDTLEPNYQSVQGLQAWWRGWYSHTFLMVSQRFSLTILDRVISPPRFAAIYNVVRSLWVFSVSLCRRFF